MPDDDQRIDLLAAAVADEARIDWDIAANVDLPADVDLVRQFKTISAIAAARRADVTSAPNLAARPLVVGYTAVIALAGLKVVVGTLVAGAGVLNGAVEWPFALNLLLFGLTGTLLIVGGAKDQRIRPLGALFVVIASAFADPVAGTRFFGVGVSALRHLPTDAFIAVAMWAFVRTFPSITRRRLARRVCDAFLVASACIGTILFVANVLLAREAFQAGRSTAFLILSTLDRHAPALAYWPLLFGMTLPAIPYLVWKSRFGTVDERRRVAFFVMALVAGLTPMLVAVIASPFVPALADPSRRRWIGLILYAALVSVVPSTVYAVAVQHVMDIHLIVHKTMQHAVARSAVWFATIGPLAYLVIDVYQHRDLTVKEFFSRGQPIGLLILPIVGFSTLTFRHQLLRGVDRWFMRDAADYTEALARLERGLRGARSIREIAGVLAKEIDRAIHSTTVAVLIVNEEGGQLATMAGTIPPLSKNSAVVELLRSVRTEIQLNLADGPIVRLLPERDREWLVEGGIQLLFPLVGSTETLLGTIALGESRSGLPYTSQDRMLITAMSGHAAMRLENRQLRELHTDERDGRPLPGLRAINWQNEPGVYCPRCSTVWAPDTPICSCGLPTKPAALPPVVKGKFRVERLIGSGGMGVVYLAVDVALDRKVAIKTLPTLTRNHSIRLQREARAMASVLHPNLALIFGAEYWRGTPLLIVEYLEGGTLSDRLRHGSLDVEEMIDLGIVLADVLDRVHASGILHRDIKPSNIGYTRDGLPKLLDFGLAAILDRSAGDHESPVGLATKPTLVERLFEGSQTATTMTMTHQIVGTPLYMSPEVLAGQSPQPSFDLWSLSLVLYEAIAGRHPFGDGTEVDVLTRIQHLQIPEARELRPDCPASVAAFFEDALAPMPERRPATASELRDRLRWLRASLSPPKH